MEHVIQLGINLDDDAIRRAVERDAKDRIIESIKRDVEREMGIERTVRPVDREALLALADEMDDLAEAWGGKYPTNRVAAYARSIREALGVSDG